MKPQKPQNSLKAQKNSFKDSLFAVASHDILRRCIERGHSCASTVKIMKLFLNSLTAGFEKAYQDDEEEN